MSTVTYHRDHAQSRLKDIRGVIWDLDNTLYKIDHIIEEAFNIAVGRAVVAAGIDLTLDQARDMARQSFAQYAHSGRLFVDRYGMSAVQLHYDYHGMLDETIIEASLELRDLFAASPHKHIVVSHGSRGWAERVLAHLGLSEWFPAGRVFGFEDYNFEAKHQHPTSFDLARTALGLDAPQIMMVEDTLKNLHIPHKLGMATAYIKHGRTFELPGYLDMSCETAVDILRALNDAQ